MAQTLFGQVAGPRLTTDKLDRDEVVKLVDKAGMWRAADIVIPTLTPADTTFIGRVSDALIGLAPEPGCRFSIGFADSTGDGDADHLIVGYKCSLY